MAHRTMDHMSALKRNIILRKLVKAGGGSDFSRKYWEMAEANPDVLVGHVKLWRLLASPPNDKKT